MMEIPPAVRVEQDREAGKQRKRGNTGSASRVSGWPS
jgi:hypothetical protein